MRSEHMTLGATTNATDASGILELKADVIYNKATSIRIPRGLALKIWSKHVNGAGITVKTQFTRDITATSPTWETIGTDVFVAAVEGDRNIEKRRPLLFRGLTGKEAIQFSYSQTAAALSGVEINVEFSAIQ